MQVNINELINSMHLIQYPNTNLTVNSSNNITVIPSKNIPASQEIRIIELRIKDKKFDQCYHKLNKCIKLNHYIPVYKKNLYKIFEDVEYMEHKYHDSLQSRHLFLNKTFMTEFINFAEKICIRYGGPFENKLFMSENEIINGYRLYNIENGNTLMTRLKYDIFNKLWNKNRKYTQYEFLDIFYSIASREWGKITIEGEYYEGFYDYPEESYEKLNAYELTFEKNALALWDLPYPHEVILETIIYTNSQFNRCVRKSNFLCEWIKRKRNQLKFIAIIPKLEDICKKVIIFNNIDISILPKVIRNNF